MKPLFNYIKNHKLKVLILSLILLGFIGILIFVQNDYFLYKETIIKVIEVKQSKTLDNNKMNTIYLQKVKAKIMNSSNKGKIIYFENERSLSGALPYDYDINKNDELFVFLDTNLNIKSLIDFKRDWTLCLELVIFTFVLILLSSKKSLLIFSSFLINALLFLLIMFLRTKQINTFMLFSFGVILWTIITLLITSGFNKKSLSAIISTLLSIFLMMSIAFLVFKTNPSGIRYEFIEFSEYIADFENVFYSGVLVSGLGAIMDVAILMATAVNELIEKNPKIKNKELRKSAWIVAEDTMGTTMNVLFFSCIVGCFPLVIYLTLNNVSINFAFTNYGLSEIIRALVGAIGIVLAIPISYLVNFFLRRGSL